MGVKASKARSFADGVMRLVAYTAVIHFISTETAANVGHLLGHADRSVPLPDFGAATWKDWLDFVSTSPAARMITAVTALCYVATEIDRGFHGDVPAAAAAKFRKRRLPALKLGAAAVVAVVIAHQVGLSMDNVIAEFRKVLSSPELAAAAAPKSLDEWVEYFTKPFSLGSFVAAIAFHYVYKEVSAAAKSAAGSVFRQASRACIGAFRKTGDGGMPRYWGRSGPRGA